MDLVSMKKPQDNSGDKEDYDKPAYSYGLCISLGADELSALGITELPPVGTEMMVYAAAYVKTVSARETQDGSDMSIGGHDRQDAAAKNLYGEDGPTESGQPKAMGSSIADALYG